MELKDKVEIIEIEKDKEEVLKNLVSTYLHDLSEFADDLKVNKEGRFEYDGIEYYFKEKELHPFLIYCNNEIAGFVLVNSGKYVQKCCDYSVHELFILRYFRGQGIASEAVKNVFAKYPGKYRIEQLKDNKLAVSFWNGFYKKHKIRYEEKEEVIDGFDCCVQLLSLNKILAQQI